MKRMTTTTTTLSRKDKRKRRDRQKEEEEESEEKLIESAPKSKAHYRGASESHGHDLFNSLLLFLSLSRKR